MKDQVGPYEKLPKRKGHACQPQETLEKCPDGGGARVHLHPGINT